MNLLFTMEQDTEELKQYVKSRLDVPEVNVRFSNLGTKITIVGANRVENRPQHYSMMLTIVFTPKSDWYNGIWQNEPNAIFEIEAGGDVELGNKSYKIKSKFRKRKFKSLDDALKAISAYCDTVMGELEAQGK